MGGVMVNFFNRFGRVWQDDAQAEGEFRTQAENVGQFYVRNGNGDMVPLTALVTMETFHGPDFTTRYIRVPHRMGPHQAVPGKPEMRNFPFRLHDKR